MMNNYDFLSHVVIHRTRVSTAFEVVCGLLVVVMWVLSLWLNVGSASDLIVGLVTSAVLTAIIVFLLWSCYHPSLFNIPVPVTNGRQVATSVRMIHVLTVEICIYFAAMPVMVHGVGGELTVLATSIAFVLVLIITIVCYCWKINRQRMRTKQRRDL